MLLLVFVGGALVCYRCICRRCSRNGGIAAKSPVYCSFKCSARAFAVQTIVQAAGIYAGAVALLMGTHVNTVTGIKNSRAAQAQGAMTSCYKDRVVMKIGQLFRNSSRLKPIRLFTPRAAHLATIDCNTGTSFLFVHSIHL